MTELECTKCGELVADEDTWGGCPECGNYGFYEP